MDVVRCIELKCVKGLILVIFTYLGIHTQRFEFVSMGWVGQPACSPARVSVRLSGVHVTSRGNSCHHVPSGWVGEDVAFARLPACLPACMHACLQVACPPACLHA